MGWDRARLASGINRPTGLTQVTFAPDTTSTFGNPERGWMGFSTLEWNAGGTRITDTWITSALPGLPAATDLRMIRLIFILSAFRTSNISAAVLADIATRFQEVRTAKLKAEVRFCYEYSGSGADASEAWITTHLTQLQSVLAANVDVIAVVNCGFIGWYGEMHDSTNNLNRNTDEAARKRVIEAVLAAVPTSRNVQVRYAHDIRNVTGGALLTNATAFNGSNLARVGLVNDYFVGDWYDGSTFQLYSGKSAEEDKALVAANSRYTVVGGEGGVLDASNRSWGATALREMEMMHWSYHNLRWNNSVLALWYSQAYGSSTYYEEIGRRLGYRFELQTVDYTATLVAGKTFTAYAKIINRGFAAPYNQRNVYFVLTKSGGYKLRLLAAGDDLRRMLPGRPSVIACTAALPSSLPSGTYSLHLEMPDPATSLIDIPEYSILCANSGIRDAATGLNLIASGIVVP